MSPASWQSRFVKESWKIFECDPHGSLTGLEPRWLRLSRPCNRHSPDSRLSGSFSRKVWDTLQKDISWQTVHVRSPMNGPGWVCLPGGRVDCHHGDSPQWHVSESSRRRADKQALHCCAYTMFLSIYIKLYACGTFTEQSQPNSFRFTFLVKDYFALHTCYLRTVTCVVSQYKARK